MRLTCPSCNAQYEVPEDAIPADGRDVQCSNCATTWFQEGRRRSVQDAPARPVRRPMAPAPEAAADEAPAPDAEDAPGIDPTPDPAPDPAPEEAPPADSVTEADAVPAGEVEADAESPRRRPLADENTLEILRQERAHEARQRAAERRRRANPAPDPETLAPAASAPEVETPVEPAPQDLDERSLAAAERDRMAEAAALARARDAAPAEGPSTTPEPDPKPEPEPEADAAPSEEPVDHDEDPVSDAIAEALRDMEDDAPELADMTPQERIEARRASRREMLPDIEEINSSLRPDEKALEAAAAADGSDAGGDAAMAGQSAFRMGFLGVSLLVLVLVGLYIFAREIGQAVPALAGPLDGFAGWVDAQRLALQISIDAVTTSILGDG